MRILLQVYTCHWTSVFHPCSLPLLGVVLFLSIRLPFFSSPPLLNVP
uniref:Uncharacterized protein n=1 Tax=Aegilops tauschii subsp. strangulata TaxID=200361 RepID=A0A453I135_AEGTS